MSSGGALGEMQITTAVNFPFLKIIAEKAGLQSCIETMLSWASRVSGERQTTPSHYVQGLAYGYAMDQQPVETSHYEIIKFLVSTHSIFTDPNLKTKIKESIEECGETEEALKRVLSYLPKFPETLVASREELGKPGFVAHTLETSLAHFILESGIFSQLASQTISISNQELVQIVPDKTQRGFRISLKPIVDELEDAGFERNSVETVLFAPDPTDSKSITGSTARVCFSATKQ